jgi:hypothetical protein
MMGYSKTHHFSRGQLQLWQEAVLLVAAVPEPEDVDSIRCHELARAVWTILAPVARGLTGCFRVADGSYGSVEHSWIVLGAQQDTILDVYCVARLPMVQLSDAGRPSAGLIGSFSLRDKYREGPARVDVDVAKVAELIKIMTDKVKL